MKILNLYSGLGGNRKLWRNAKITAVEKNPSAAAIYKQMYPQDELIIGDAHNYLLKNHEHFDFVWSSPPCQSHSKMIKATRHDVRKFPDMKLYEEIIWLSHFFKGKWIVENVKPYYKPLIEPSLTLGRHCIWANFDIGHFMPPTMENFIQAKTGDVKKWLGLDFTVNVKAIDGFRLDQSLRNCVHPTLGLHIFSEMKRSINSTGNLGRIQSMKAKAIRIKQKQYEEINSIY